TTTCFGDVARAIAEHHRQAGVRKCSSRDAGEVLLRYLDDLGVEFDQGHGVDRVLDHLPERAAVAAADDQNISCVSVRDHRHMGDHLMVDMAVSFGELDDAVEHEHLSECWILEHENVLVVGPARAEDTCDRKILSMVGIEPLLECVHGISPRLCSTSVTARGMKAPRMTSKAL